jgi:RNA polymerase sigma-70 factor (ECF subfamily)
MQAALDAMRGTFGDAAPAGARDGDPDVDVIELVERGELHAALGRLMKRHGEAIYRYCREALRDPALADDVLQQVFLGAFRDLPRFAGRATVRTWLFSIARYRVLDAVRRRLRAEARIAQATAADPPAAPPSPADSLDDTRLRAALVASLGELGEPVRTAVLLRYQQGFSFDEMAAICRERPATLRARVARALPVMRASIEARLATTRV